MMQERTRVSQSDVAVAGGNSCFFLPETGFYPFTRGLAVLGAALQSHGRKVFFTRCTGQMPHCSMLVGHGVPLEETEKAKKVYCPRCRMLFDAAQKNYLFESVDLADLDDDVMREKLREIDTLSPAALARFTVDGFPIAQIIQYDFSLEAKAIYSPESCPERTELYRAFAANTYRALHYSQKIATLHDIQLFCTFNHYAQCNAVRYTAQRKGIPYKALTYQDIFNADCSQFYLDTQEFSQLQCKRARKWPEIRHYPAPADKVYECWQDSVFRNMGRGSHIYSSQKAADTASLFDSLDLKKERKLIVAYTSSSDENDGLEFLWNFWGEHINWEMAFPDQVAWLQDLQSWAASREDVQVVVRVHPREGKNKNYKHGSTHLELMRTHLPTKSDNFLILWPEDFVSSYDLLELAHACVVPWTTMGIEAARVGVPVLSCVGNMYYVDDDFIQVATNQTDYRKRLNALVGAECTWDMLTKAVRYYHWRSYIPCLDLRETVSILADDGSQWPLPSKDMGTVIVDILEERQDLPSYTKERWLRNLPDDAAAREKDANLRGVRLYLDYLFTPRIPQTVSKQSFFIRACRKALRILHLPIPNILAPSVPPAWSPPDCKDYLLEFHCGVDKLEESKMRTSRNNDLRILVAEDDSHVWFVRGGSAIRRLSPLSMRLGRFFSPPSGV